MADIKIVKIKIRRGTDSQRRSTLLDQGELGYTTDTKRLFIGNGVLSGGQVVGSKFHPALTNYYSLSSTNAETGDIVVANNIMYQLTGTNYAAITGWADVSQKFDSTYFENDISNVVTLKDDSITPTKLDSSLIGQGLIINAGTLKADINSSTIAFSSNQISIKDGGVREHQLHSSVFTNGISGGSGDKVGIKFDPSTLYLKYGDTLAVSAFPAGSVTFESLDTSWFGRGLDVDVPNQVINSTISDADGVSIFKNLSGVISLQSGLVSGYNEWASVFTDTYGRVSVHRSSIYDTVSCLSAVGIPGVDMGPLSSIFNGTPNQSLSGALNNTPLTMFTVLSSNTSGTVALTLSSAGFLMFQGDSTARQDGKYVGRFAIPIFAY